MEHSSVSSLSVRDQGDNLATKSSQLDQLCHRINDVRRRYSSSTVRVSARDNGDLRHAQWNWFQIMHYHFLNAEVQNRPNDADDLLYFVRKARKEGLWNNERGRPQIEVYRRNSPSIPTPEDEEIDFEETVYLNVILHYLHYTATVCICSRTSPSDIQVIRRLTIKLFATVHKPQHLQGVKTIEHELGSASALISYPEIYFPVEDFENIFSNFSLRDSESICVELVASDFETAKSIAVLFQGSVRYEALQQAIMSRKALGATMGGFGGGPGGGSYAALSRRFLRTSRLTQLLNTGSGSNNSGTCEDDRLGEIIKMKGPQGKGLAEVSVLQQKTLVTSTRPTTPSSSYYGGGEMEESSFGGGFSSDGDYAGGQHQTLRRQSDLNDATSVLRRNVGGRNSSSSAVLPIGSAWYTKQQQSNMPQRNEQQRQPPSNIQSNNLRRCQSETGLPDSDAIEGWEEVHAVDFQQEAAGNAELTDQPWSVRGFNQAWHWFREKRRDNCVALRTRLMCVKLPWTSIINDILDERTAPVLTL